MASWETYDLHGDENHRRDFVLQQPSTLGPWVTLILSVTLVAFLGYLVYVNVLLPPPIVASADRASRFVTNAGSPLMPARLPTRYSTERRKTAVTVIPPGQAPNALLGGQGPALPLEQVTTPWPNTSPLPRTTRLKQELSPAE